MHCSQLFLNSTIPNFCYIKCIKNCLDLLLDTLRKVRTLIGQAVLRECWFNSPTNVHISPFVYICTFQTDCVCDGDFSVTLSASLCQKVAWSDCLYEWATEPIRSGRQHVNVLISHCIIHSTSLLKKMIHSRMI